MTTTALVLVLAGTAPAETFCVQLPECPDGTPAATVQEALDAADVDPAIADTVLVGPGTYEGPFLAESPVTVSGSAGGATVLRATGTGVAVLTLPAPDSRVEQLTVEAGDGIGLAAAAVVVRHVAVDLDGAAAGTAISLAPAAGAPSSTLQGVTIAGRGVGTGLEVRAVAEAASVALEDSVITGVAQDIRTCSSAPPTCDPGRSVTTSYSAYDADKTEGDVVGTPAPGSADPKLDAALRPRFDSPLVDAANPATPVGGLDASGLPRVRDGDGVDGARRDIGALEYQRRAPEITASSATPATALVGAPVTFSGTAIDPDGETLTPRWSFSDGATAAGLDVTHAFAEPGAARATLTLTDPTGLVATASVPVTITAPASPASPAAPASPPPPADPGPGATRPRVLVRVVPEALRLRALAKRDRRPPYRFRLRGRVVLPDGISSAGCAGGVIRLAVRAGKRKRSQTAELRGDCSFRFTLELGRKRARRVVVTPRFTGTAALAPRDGSALRLRAG